MNRSELTKTISETSGVDEKDVNEVLKAFIKKIPEAVANGDDVSLVGFGTFTTTKRQERKGRNPQTGEELIIPASTVPRFKPGKAFKEAVN